MKIANLTVEQSTDRATVYRLATGQVFAVPHPPGSDGVTISQDVHEAAVIVREAVANVAVTDINRRTLAADQLLSDLGRKAKLEPIVKAAAEGVTAAAAKLEILANKVDAAEARAFAPPELNSSDLAGAMVDVELRQWLRGLRGNERAEAISRLADEPRLMEAVLRSPTKLGQFSSQAAEAWRRHIEATSPAAAQVAKQREAVEWARSVIAAAGGALS